MDNITAESEPTTLEKAKPVLRRVAIAVGSVAGLMLGGLLLAKTLTPADEPIELVEVDTIEPVTDAA